MPEKMKEMFFCNPVGRKQSNMVMLKWSLSKYLIKYIYVSSSVTLNEYDKNAFDTHDIFDEQLL